MVDYRYIMRSILFDGLEKDQVESFLKSIDARVVRFKRDEFIYRVGDIVDCFGLVLSGSVRIERVSPLGEISIVYAALPGKTFSESQACLPDHLSLVDIIAHEDCSILMMNAARLMRSDSDTYEFHHRIVHNFAQLLAVRNLDAARRNAILGERTTREKVLSYLHLQELGQGSSTFDIPFNREQLAHYLCVDRSALSATLSSMRKAGEIDFRKNHFTIFSDNL